MPEKFDVPARDNAELGHTLALLVDDMPLEPGLLDEVRKGEGSFVYREDGTFIEHDFFTDTDEQAPRVT